MNDIALLKLPSPINFTDKILPICLSNEDYAKPKTRTYVTGWVYSSFIAQFFIFISAVYIFESLKYPPIEAVFYACIFFTQMGAVLGADGMFNYM